MINISLCLLGNLIWCFVSWKKWSVRMSCTTYWPVFVGPIILCHITQMCIPHLYKLLGRILLKSTLQHLVSSWCDSPFMETREPPPTLQHLFDLITPQPHHCMAVFVGSALQGRDIGRHWEMGQRCPYTLESCCVHCRNISDITTEGSTWAWPC